MTRDIYYTLVYWTILNACTSINYMAAFWVHVIYFTISKLFDNIYLTSLYKILLSTCTLLHCIEALWVHVSQQQIEIFLV